MKSIPQVIIDTDMGFDDLMAILYLLNRQDVEVIAVTINGNSACHSMQGATNALKLLHLAAKRTKQIPVAYGDEEPMDGFHAYPESWRLATDILYGVQLPDSLQQTADLTAVDLLISLLTSSDHPVTILAIGSLTNIAEAIEKEPAIRTKIERLVIMAGALRVPGHVAIPGVTEHLNGLEHLRNTVTSWNEYVDPLATQKVLRSGVPITLVPLDASNKVPLSQDFAMVFREKAGSPEAKVLDAVFEYCMDSIKAGIYYCWDPLAAFAITDRDILRFQYQKLDVMVKYDADGLVDKTSFSLTRKDGKPRQAFDLYVSGQIIESEGGQRVEVCTDVDASAFYQRFIEVINRQHPS